MTTYVLEELTPDELAALERYREKRGRGNDISVELTALRTENASLRAECEAAENFVNYLQEFLAFDAAWGDSEGHHWTKYQQARAAHLTAKEQP